jgi:hypothetical protein
VRFRQRGTAPLSKSGMKRMSGSTERQRGRTLGGGRVSPRARGQLQRTLTSAEMMAVAAATVPEGEARAARARSHTAPVRVSEREREREHAAVARARAQTQVRKTPSWPRSWANSSRLQLYSHMNAWANLHLLGQPNTILAARRWPRRHHRSGARPSVHRPRCLPRCLRHSPTAAAARGCGQKVRSTGLAQFARLGPAL